MAASSGVFLGPQFHFDLVRPGISLYGGRPNQTALDTDEVRRITEVLAMHPRKLTPDIVLPGTVSL